MRFLVRRRTSQRLPDIKQPTLILVGDGDVNMTSEINHRMSTEVLAQGIANSKVVLLPHERHSYFFSNPDLAHNAIREFIKD